jgi:hypothetical protein
MSSGNAGSCFTINHDHWVIKGCRNEDYPKLPPGSPTNGVQRRGACGVVPARAGRPVRVSPPLAAAKPRPLEWMLGGYPIASIWITTHARCLTPYSFGLAELLQITEMISAKLIDKRFRSGTIEYSTPSRVSERAPDTPETRFLVVWQSDFATKTGIFQLKNRVSEPLRQAASLPQSPFWATPAPNAPLVGIYVKF